MKERNIRILEAFGEPIMTGGQESFVFGVLEKIDMTGLTIDCLTAYDWQAKNYKKLVHEKGGQCFSLKLPFTPGKSRRNIKKPLSEFLKKHHYDVIHIHSGSISVLAIMAEVADKAGVKKVIVHSHATGQGDNLKHKVLRFAASLSMRRHVDIYCACSKEAAEWKFEKKYAEKALIIKNGIDTERFRYNPEKREEMRRKLNIPDHSFVIGHVGRFSWEKNHKYLIQVFEEVSKRDHDARLLLLGDGEDMAEVRRLVEAKELEEKVIFTGSVTNVEDYLQAMDVFVLPSVYEGLGIVTVEAIAASLPVIVSENVPFESHLGSIFKKMPLGQEDKWADEILKCKISERTDQSSLIRNAGYDISNTAKTVRKLYIEV